MTHPKELLADELDVVSGGMKYDPNHVSPDVIDARGGQVTVYGLTFTYGANGQVTSVTAGLPR
jgi:hypothetical protein